MRALIIRTATATKSRCDRFRSLARSSHLLAFVAALLLTGCKPKNAGPSIVQHDSTIPVTVVSAHGKLLDRTLPVVGTLYAKTEAAIGAQVEGQIEKTEVDFGQDVKAGKELALIDTDSYEAFAGQAAASVAKAKASALNAEQSLKRVIELQKSRISSGSDLDSATAMAEQARAEVKAAQAAEAIARLNLHRSHVLAPFDGTISERIVNTGDFVKIGAPLYKVVEDRELKYIVQVPEKYSGQVKVGQVIQLTIDAAPDQCFEGSVYLISPSVSTATRSFNVGARLDNSERKLKANTFARGELILEKAVPTVTIPLEAVINFAGVTKVFVIKSEAAASREVKLGRILGGEQEVINGLREGETVALTGTTKLFENAKVRILPSTGTPQKTDPASSLSAS